MNTGAKLAASHPAQYGYSPSPDPTVSQNGSMTGLTYGSRPNGAASASTSTTGINGYGGVWGNGGFGSSMGVTGYGYNMNHPSPKDGSSVKSSGAGYGTATGAEYRYGQSIQGVAIQPAYGPYPGQYGTQHYPATPAQNSPHHQQHNHLNHNQHQHSGSVNSSGYPGYQPRNVQGYQSQQGVAAGYYPTSGVRPNQQQLQQQHQQGRFAVSNGEYGQVYDATGVSNGYYGGLSGGQSQQSQQQQGGYGGYVNQGNTPQVQVAGPGQGGLGVIGQQGRGVINQGGRKMW
jgi:hypothetical protein